MQFSLTKIIGVQNSKFMAAIGIKKHGVKLPFEEKDNLQIFIEDRY